MLFCKIVTDFLVSSNRGENVKCFLMASETPPLIFFGFCCDCHSDLNTPSSPVNQNNFGLLSARVFLLRFVTRATKKTLRSLQTDVTMRERLWLDMPYLGPSGLLLTFSSHVFQEWIHLQEVVAHNPCQAADGGWVLSGSPAQRLVLSPVLNNNWEMWTKTLQDKTYWSWSCKCCPILEYLLLSTVMYCRFLTPLIVCQLD